MIVPTSREHASCNGPVDGCSTLPKALSLSFLQQTTKGVLQVKQEGAEQVAGATIRMMDGRLSPDAS